MAQKNVILISIDDMRTPDDWGHFTPLISTPNIDRLMGAGTTFERAITQVPLCNPSRTSVMTGRQPTETGVLDNEVRWFDRIDPAKTLPAQLKAAGVYVAMYGKHFHVHPIDPTDQAVMFDEFVQDSSFGSVAQVIDDEVRHDSPFASGRYGGSPANISDERTADAAVKFLTKTAPLLDRSFFLGVGINKPHLNWWSPTEYFDRYDPEAIRDALRLSLGDGTIIPGNGEYFDVPPMMRPSDAHLEVSADFDMWADYIHGYLAAISYADAKIGEVLDALDSDPDLKDDTAILLWSDHGYNLGDKDRWGKFTHWREATEVPFVIVDPQAEVPAGGQTAEQIVSLVDIFPTVFDLLGLEAPRDLGLRGHSLLPIVQQPNIDWFDPATGKGLALTTVYGSVSIRADVPGVGDLRYTRYPDGTEELYDLTRDPGEHVNRVNYDTGKGLTARDDQLRAIMGSLMDDHLEDVGLLVSDGTNPVLGTDANELLSTTRGLGLNVLSGGDGDDTYVLYKAATLTERAGEGLDGIVILSGAVESSFVLPDNFEMLKVWRNATGNGADNWLYSEVSGTLKGMGGNDEIYGGDGNDSMRGGAGNDTLYGNAGDDVANGDSGADFIYAGAGNDTMAGAAGADVLSGSTGSDVFDFDAVGQSGPTGSDTLMGFDGPGRTAGDRIDLSTIDANVLISGNQAFAFGGTGTGKVWLANLGTDTVVYGSVDGDAPAELRIVIRDGAVLAAAYTAADFIL